MKFLKMLKHCLHPAVVLGVIAAIALAYVFAPQVAEYSWVLIALICPLSMMLMMAMMNRDQRHDADKDDTKQV
jgi:peptidoglycan/LPS O-acetylase OafA/YrhL